MSSEASPDPRVSRPTREPDAPVAGRARRPRLLVWMGARWWCSGAVRCSVDGAGYLFRLFDARAAVAPRWVGALLPVGAVVALLLVRPLRWVLAGILVAFVMVLAAWLAIPPSNVRDWQPDVMTLPFADIQGDHVLVHNVRNVE